MTRYHPKDFKVSGTQFDMARSIVKRLHGTHIVLGPIVWTMEPGEDRKRWYCNISASDKRGKFVLDQIMSYERSLVEELRNALRFAIIQRKRTVLHDCDDELFQAKLCEAIWPCPKTRNIREAVERDSA